MGDTERLCLHDSILLVGDSPTVNFYNIKPSHNERTEECPPAPTRDESRNSESPQAPPNGTTSPTQEAPAQNTTSPDMPKDVPNDHEEKTIAWLKSALQDKRSRSRKRSSGTCTANPSSEHSESSTANPNPDGDTVPPRNGAYVSPHQANDHP